MRNTLMDIRGSVAPSSMLWPPFPSLLQSAAPTTFPLSATTRNRCRQSQNRSRMPRSRNQYTSSGYLSRCGCMITPMISSSKNAAAHTVAIEERSESLAGRSSKSVVLVDFVAMVSKRRSRGRLALSRHSSGHSGNQQTVKNCDTALCSWSAHLQQTWLQICAPSVLDPIVRGPTLGLDPCRYACGVCIHHTQETTTCFSVQARTPKRVAKLSALLLSLFSSIVSAHEGYTNG